MKSSDIVKKAHRSGVEFVQIQFMSIDGRVKSMTVSMDSFEDGIDEGWGIDGSSIAGYAEIENSDQILIPDLKTFKVLPWRIKGRVFARILCDVCHADGHPHGADPRHVLDKALRSAEAKGYSFPVGAEVEFYTFKKGKGKKPTDEGKYFDTAPYDKGEMLRLDLAAKLEGLGYTVEKIHHEVNPGQHEINFKFGDALETADNIVLSRQALMALGDDLGLVVDYSAKPLPKGMGNGLHCHHRLSDAKTGKNLFYDQSGEYRMTELARQFLAGVLDHAPALTPLAASTPNSYKRLVPGFEAPVYICWGGPNRSVLIRVPGYEIRRGKGMRLEYRTPDAMCNPYLLFTGLLAAGLDGIERKLDPGPPVKMNVYKMSEKKRKELGIAALPGNLDDALDALESDRVIKKALGETMLKEYVALKREEAIKG